MPKYTAEEVATLVVMRSGGSSYKEINEVLVEKFGNDRKPEALSAKYNTIISSKEKQKVSDNLKVQRINSEKNWRSENATRRQLRLRRARNKSQRKMHASRGQVLIIGLLHRLFFCFNSLLLERSGSRLLRF